MLFIQIPCLVKRGGSLQHLLIHLHYLKCHSIGSGIGHLRQQYRVTGDLGVIRRSLVSVAWLCMDIGIAGLACWLTAGLGPRCACINLRLSSLFII